jgi:hypothetical protein
MSIHCDHCHREITDHLPSMTYLKLTSTSSVQVGGPRGWDGQHVLLRAVFARGDRRLDICGACTEHLMHGSAAGSEARENVMQEDPRWPDEP